MATAKFGGIPGPRGARGPAGPTGAVLDGVSVATYGALGVYGADATAAVQRAANTGAGNVYFPPGSYMLGAVTFSTAKQCITFAPGAVLYLTADSAVLFSGVRQRIAGLEFTLNTASESSGTPVEVRGAGALVDGVRVNVDADVPNVSLIKLSGDRVRVNALKLVGAGKAFKYALHIISSDGSMADDVIVDGFDADVGDDGATTTYGALVYWRGNRSEIKDMTCATGGRSLFPTGAIIVDGNRNVLTNPGLTLSEAPWGVYRKDGAEFFTVQDGMIQGRNNGTFLADSEGIYSGHLTGHLKVKNTAITGWDWAVGLHGSHDAPAIDGGVLANNGSGAILIDSEIAGQAWPVSGMRLSGMYHEEQVQDNDQVILCRSGSLHGLVMSGCHIGYHNRVLKVETGFTNCGGVFIGNGNRFSGVPGAGVVEPHAASEITFGSANTLDGSNTVGIGAHAAVVKLETDPVLAGVTIGTAGVKLTRYITTSVTANFASVLTAGTSFDLGFTLTGASVGDQLAWSIANGLASRPGLMFSAWISAANTVVLRAYNFSGSTVTSASGNVRFSAWKH